MGRGIFGVYESIVFWNRTHMSKEATTSWASPSKVFCPTYAKCTHHQCQLL